jgi:hypothetical protein
MGEEEDATVNGTGRGRQWLQVQEPQENGQPEEGQEKGDWQPGYYFLTDIDDKGRQEMEVWDPNDPYDPRRANDYYEYKNYKQWEHEEARERRIQERERKRSRRSPSASYSENSDGDDRYPRKAGVSRILVLNWYSNISQADMMMITRRTNREASVLAARSRTLMSARNPHSAKLPRRSIRLARKRIYDEWHCLPLRVFHRPLWQTRRYNLEMKHINGVSLCQWFRGRSQTQTRTRFRPPRRRPFFPRLNLPLLSPLRLLYPPLQWPL